MNSSSQNGLPLRSMTGFAQVRSETCVGSLSVSLRGVNHRGLDLHFYLSGEFAPFEPGLRTVLKEHIVRGHVEIRVSLTRDPGQPQELPYNADVLKAYHALFQRAATDLGLEHKPDLVALLGMPGVLAEAKNSAKEFDPAFEREFLEAAATCILAFNECREREGAQLKLALLAELSEIEKATEEIMRLRGVILPTLAASLRERLIELLHGSSLSEARIAEEAALLADRSDIQEELTRLCVHARELRRILGAGGPAGKPLDFLLQEMNREANTTLSKNPGATEPALRITQLALGVKANIERIREQSLNFE